MRRGSVICVVVVLLLAGCGGGPDSTTAAPTDTVTNASVDEMTPAEQRTLELETASESDLPPGMGAVGPESVTAFTEAVTGQLRQPYRGQLNVSGSDGETGSITVINDSEARFVRLSMPDEFDGEVYVADQVAGIDNRSSGRVSYSYGQTTVRQGAAFLSVGFEFLIGISVRVTRWEPLGVEPSDGQRLLVVSATGLNQTALDGRYSIGQEGETPVNRTGQLFVTDTGLPRRMILRTAYDTREGSITRTLNLSVDQVGTASAPRPDWLDQFPQLTTSLADDGRVLVIEHTGGPSLEAGTEFTVRDGRESVGTVTVPETIEDGETMYATLDGDPELVVGEQPSPSADARSFTGEFSSISLVQEGPNRRLALGPPRDTE